MISFLFLMYLPLSTLGSPPPWSYSYIDQSKPKQVQVNVFYESLCPDSKNFIVHTLSNTYSLLSPHMSITLVPFGKAKTTQTQPSYNFSCQHGPAECQGNLYHNCAEKYIKDQSIKIKFVSCLFKEAWSTDGDPDWHQITIQCSHSVGLAGGLVGKVYNCAVDLEGKQLHYEAGQRTGTKVFIPTVEIGGGREGGNVVLDTREGVHNLVTEVCKQYQNMFGDTLNACH